MNKDEKKAIHEMAEVIKHTERLAWNVVGASPSAKMIATDLYNKGYRKQSEGINVEEMAEMLEIIEKAREEYANDITDHTENEYIREALLNANYRKQGVVIDEFVKRLKEAPIRCAYPLFGLSTKAEIELHFNDIMLQVGDAIDSIAKEMKGGTDIVQDPEHRCLYCQEIIPQGIDVCPKCEKERG